MFLPLRRKRSIFPFKAYFNLVIVNSYFNQLIDYCSLNTTLIRQGDTQRLRIFHASQNKEIQLGAVNYCTCLLIVPQKNSEHERKFLSPFCREKKATHELSPVHSTKEK